MINSTGNRMTLEIRRQSTLARQISDTQISISTGKDIQRPSDDPVGAARVATLRQSQSDTGVWRGNIMLAISLTAQADGVLANASSRLARAQELTVAGANGNLAPADRATIAQELRGIADDLDSYATTTSSLGQPLFATQTALAIRFDGDTVFAPVPARSDIFETSGVAISQTVRDAADAIENGNAGGIATALSTIQNGVTHIADGAAGVGTRAARIDTIRETLNSRDIINADERSSIEDTDLSEAIARLNSQTLTLEAAQAAFARINRRTLFDILG